ncbi:MAG: metal ABC transporter permease [Bacillota bacterium]
MDLYITFSIIAIGALVAGSAGMVGSFLILRRMAMLGDAISHAVLPGIAIAFLLTHSRSPLVMVIGAAVFGLVTAWLVQTLQRAGVQEDAGIGVTFTALFAIGVVLIALFAGRVHLDLEHVLYGEIAYAPWDQWIVGGLNLGPRALWTMGAIFLIDLAVITLFFKELKLCAFDPSTAAALGINVTLFHYLLMTLVSITTVGAFDSVGAILVVAMLVVPGATAYLLTERLSTMLALAVAQGALSSLLGYFLARVTDSSIAAAMSTVSGFLFLLAFLLAPGTGLIARLIQRRRSLPVSSR